MNDANAPAWIDDYSALKDAGWLILDDRLQIEITGSDRARFVHNLCTNEVRKLAVGAGCEAFVTSVQGKTLAHGFVFATENSIVLDTVGVPAEKLLAHLDKYLVSEDVQLIDRSTQWTEVYCGGANVEGILTTLGAELPASARLSHSQTKFAGCEIQLRRVDLSGPNGFLIGGERAAIQAIGHAISQAGAKNVARPSFEAARIEWGFPWFGDDISDDNLPQEIDRDSQAISFVKGCYLGQETVARIDALGHVNRKLVGLRFLSDKVPTTGEPLLAEGKPVGKVTSASFSPQWSSPLALGYVKRGHNAIGTQLEYVAGAVEIVKLASQP